MNPILLTIVSFSGLQGADLKVADSADKVTPLTVGTQAPSNKLLTMDGKTVKLKDVLNGKPTVLIFYRGGWCPFCNAHLGDLEAIQPDLKKLGYQMVAITPDLPSETLKIAEKQKLDYTLFSDPKAKAMSNFGVAFRVDDATFKLYRDTYKIDLEKSSGATHHVLPVPSVFVIDKAGKIAFVHANADYKVRMKGSEVLAAAKEALH